MLELAPPALVLSVLLVVGYAALLHLWGGRSLQELFLYLAAAGIGFAVGQLLGLLLQMPLPRIGQVHVVEATVFAWLALIGAREWAGARRAGNP
jgi:hypothetical protein